MPRIYASGNSTIINNISMDATYAVRWRHLFNGQVHTNYIGYWVGSHWVGRQSTTALLNPETKLKGTPNDIAETSLN